MIYVCFACFDLHGLYICIMNHNSVHCLYSFMLLLVYITKQDRNVYSLPHCDRFVYLMNNEKVEIIKAVMDFLL